MAERGHALHGQPLQMLMVLVLEGQGAQALQGQPLQVLAAFGCTESRRRQGLRRGRAQAAAVAAGMLGRRAGPLSGVAGQLQQDRDQPRHRMAS